MRLTEFVKSDFIKHVGLLFSGSGIASLVSFIAIPILSRLYPPTVHGDINAFLQVVAIGVAVSALKFEQAIMVADSDDEARNIVKLSSLINLFWYAVFTLLVLIAKPLWVQLFSLETFESWIYFIPLTIFLAGMIEILLVWWNRRRKYRKLGMNRIAIATSSVSYKLLHPKLALFHTNGLVLGHVIGQLIGFVHLLPKSFVSHFRLNVHELKVLFKKYKSFPTWALPSTLVNVVGIGLPVLIISYYFGRETNGFFGNALKLTYLPMGTVSLAIGQVFFERLARLKTDDKRFSLSKQILHFLFWLAVLPVAFMAVYGDSIGTFVLGIEWLKAGQMAQIVVVFYFVMYISSPFASAFEVYNKLHVQFIYTLLFTLLSSAGLLVSIGLGYDIFIGLSVFSFVGILVRLAMLYHCFYLIGLKIIRQIFIGFAILVLGLAGLIFLRYMFA